MVPESSRTWLARGPMNLEIAVNNQRLAATLSLSDGNVIVSDLSWPEELDLSPELRDTLAISLLLDVLREGLDHLNARPNTGRAPSSPTALPMPSES